MATVSLSRAFARLVQLAIAVINAQKAIAPVANAAAASDMIARIAVRL